MDQQRLTKHIHVYFFKLINRWGLWIALGLAALGQLLISQRENPHTLLPGLFFLILGAFLFSWVFRGHVFSDANIYLLSPVQEAGVLFFIFLIALALRIYRLNEFPAGIFADQASDGCSGLRVLYEGWRPFFDDHKVVWDLPLFYLLAVWFKFLAISRVHFFLFSVFFSLLCFPLIYWTFRQLAGPRTALLAIFILAVMRWHITYSRDFHPAFQMPFYMFGTLAFWIYAIKNQKNWAFWVGGVFLGVGFYCYQGFKVFFILMAAYILFEWMHPKENALRRMAWAVVPLMGVLIASPLWIHAFIYNNFEFRQELFIFPSILKDGNPIPLFRHFLETALMFNREGDPWFLHNLPQHRMLDDVTGVLFVLGFAFAITRLNERKYFYPFAGVQAMCLPAFLSVNATHASRAFGTIPFICLLAALTVSVIWARVQKTGTVMGKKLFFIILAAALGLMFLQNFQTYFYEQAKNDDCWRDPSTNATIVAEVVQAHGNNDEYYVSSHFFQRYVILFLDYFQKSHIHELNLPVSLPLEGIPPGRGVLFALEEGDTGVLQLLQNLYPGGLTTISRDENHFPFVYFYHISHDAVERNQARIEKILKSPRGLRGDYYLSTQFTGHPAWSQKDLLLNFTFRNDFPVRQFPSFSAHWKGWLLIPLPGQCRFLSLATDPVILWVDGKKILTRENTESPEVKLRKGAHKIEVFFQKTAGFDTAFTLLWKLPGNSKYDVIPFTAFMNKTNRL